MENKESIQTVLEENVELRKAVADSIKLKKLKRALITAALVAVLIIVAVLATFFAAQKRVAEKYEDTVTELTNRIIELEDQVVVLDEVSKEVNLSVINTEIKEVGELVTIEYLYTDAGKFSDPKKIFGKNIPFTTKSFITKWDGIIKAGIDVTQITTELDEANKVLTVYLPQAEILSHEIDADSVETLDESDGLFNPVRVEDVRAFDAETKLAMEERALENGLLEKALENSKAVLTNLLFSDPILKEYYTINFKIN